MLRKGTLKILTVEASMIFLAITVKGITAENETAHVQRIVVASENTMATDTQEPVEPETITADETDRLVYSRDWDADEEEILLKVAMAEAEGESTEGKALVMLVVLNRVWSDGFPDSIGEVVFQKNQFSVTMDGGRYYTTSPNEDCYKAMELVKSGWDESKGALYFESCDRASWHSRKNGGGNKVAWISVDQKLIGGKLRSLYKSIGCSQNEAMGILVFLWLWGIDNAGMDGLIVSADRSDIADVLKPGLAPGLDAETVVETLIQNHWIDEVDGELYFHDWSEWRSYYNKYIKDKKSNAERQAKFKARKRQEAEENAENNVTDDVTTNDTPEQETPPEVKED